MRVCQERNTCCARTNGHTPQSEHLNSAALFIDFPFRFYFGASNKSAENKFEAMVASKYSSVACSAVTLNGEGLDFGLDFEVGNSLQMGNSVKLHMDGLIFVSLEAVCLQTSCMWLKTCLRSKHMNCVYEERKRYLVSVSQAAVQT